MTDDLQNSIDPILRKVTSGSPRVAGVVAIATDRNANIYEGAAGKRMLGQDADMTTDSVFAIFSTTKAITGTAALQLVEDGRIDPSFVVTHRVPLQDAPRAYETFKAKEDGCIKVVLKP